MTGAGRVAEGGRFDELDIRRAEVRADVRQQNGLAGVSLASMSAFACCVNLSFLMAASKLPHPGRSEGNGISSVSSESFGVHFSCFCRDERQLVALPTTSFPDSAAPAWEV